MVSDERLLLLHGTPLSPAVWEPVIAAWGRSPQSVSVPDLNVLVARSPGVDLHREVAAQVVAGLPPGRHHVVGHSFGGQVALDVALLAPGPVERVTVLCARDTPFPSFAAAAAALRAGAPADVAAGLTRWFRPDELAADGPVVRYARRCLTEADHATWAATLDAIARYDRTGRVGTLTAPVTLLAAEHDRVSTPDAMAAMAQRLPHGTFRVLAGAAHLSPFLDPTALAHLLGAPARG